MAGCRTDRGGPLLGFFDFLEFRIVRVDDRLERSYLFRRKVGPRVSFSCRMWPRSAIRTCLAVRIICFYSYWRIQVDAPCVKVLAQYSK